MQVLLLACCCRRLVDGRRRATGRKKLRRSLLAPLSLANGAGFLRYSLYCVSRPRLSFPAGDKFDLVLFMIYVCDGDGRIFEYFWHVAFGRVAQCDYSADVQRGVVSLAVAPVEMFCDNCFSRGCGVVSSEVICGAGRTLAWLLRRMERSMVCPLSSCVTTFICSLVDYI